MIFTEFIDIEKKINAYLTDVKVNNGFASRKLTTYLKNQSFILDLQIITKTFTKVFLAKGVQH